MRGFRRPRLWIAIWVLGWVLGITLSLLPPIELGAPPDSDKLGHFLAYAALSTWSVMIFAGRRAQALSALALILLGIGLEFAQAELTTTRMGDSRDALANTLGVLAGLMLAATPVSRWLQHLDRKLFGGGAEPA